MFVCIAGKNNISVDVLSYLIQNHKSKYELGIVCNKNECGYHNWQKSLRFFARENNIREYTLEEIYKKENVVFISLEFDQIVKPKAFCNARLYNIHFSLLPQYRGMYTSTIPLLNGEKTTGVTLHEIDCGIDTGDIIAQKEIEIQETDTSRDLYFKYMKNGTELVLQYIELLLDGKVQKVPQRVDGATYYSKSTLDYTNIQIDLKKTAYEIRNQIRAFCFREYQLPMVNKKPIIATEITNRRSVGKAGTIVIESTDRMIVATVDYDIILYYDRFEELQEACRSGDIEKVQEICMVPAHINSIDMDGRSPLTLAVLYNQLEIAKYLIMHGADIAIKDNRGEDLLAYAQYVCSQYGDDRLFQLLIKSGLQQNSEK